MVDTLKTHLYSSDLTHYYGIHNMRNYTELKAVQVALLDVNKYLRIELADVKYCSNNDHESGWFAGQRMLLEDAIDHVDTMINDVENKLESL